MRIADKVNNRRTRTSLRCEAVRVQFCSLVKGANRSVLDELRCLKRNDGSVLRQVRLQLRRDRCS